MSRLFEFDPAKYAAHFAEHGYVHIKQGVTQEFFDKMVAQVEENIQHRKMKEFAIGDKQQAMYSFPDDGSDYATELCNTIAAVVGVDAEKMVMSERHVKAYDATAAAEPHAHKDRFASEFSVGLSVHVKEGSTLVLYPYDELETNPFNTSVQLRASLSPEQYPEPRLKKVKRIEIKDAARDVIVFRGHKVWHLRANPALTTMLYFKMNAFNCDPMGEDRRTEAFGLRTKEVAELGDDAMGKAVADIGRRVDYFHTHYNRNWEEVPGVVLWGEKHFSVDADEMRMLRAMDGKRTAGEIAAGVANGTGDKVGMMNKLRRLARRGVIDLIPPKS